MTYVYVQHKSRDTATETWDIAQAKVMELYRGWMDGRGKIDSDMDECAFS